jgi:hypothetical protein
LQQRSWWLVVTDDPTPTRIEAAGRALGALKLWRNGRDLVTKDEQPGSIASPPAHPLNSIVLSGLLPPGTYRITAYGAPKHVRGTKRSALLKADQRDKQGQAGCVRGQI